MVPHLLHLSFAGAIAGEELILFDGRGVFLRHFEISPRNCGNEKLCHTQHFFSYCFVSSLLFVMRPTPSYNDHYVLSQWDRQQIGLNLIELNVIVTHIRWLRRGEDKPKGLALQTRLKLFNKILKNKHLN